MREQPLCNDDGSNITRINSNNNTRSAVERMDLIPTYVGRRREKKSSLWPRIRGGRACEGLGMSIGLAYERMMMARDWFALHHQTLLELFSHAERNGFFFLHDFAFFHLM